MELVHINPEEFFRESVLEALTRQQRVIGVHEEFYIVNLLCNFLSPEHLSTQDPQIDVFDTPLAIMLKHALEAPESQRVKILKLIGDTSLYVSGFFPEYLEAKSLSPDYYASMGRGAYEQIAQIMSRWNEHNFSDLYEQLSEHFVDNARVICDVGQHDSLRNQKSFQHALQAAC